MTVNAPCQNYLKPVQYVEVGLRIMPLFCMVTSGLTKRNQSILIHSPFPLFILHFVPTNNSCERIFYMGKQRIIRKSDA